jgi:hypothetical protein
MTDKQQIIAALQNLASCIETTAVILKKSTILQPELRKHAVELGGAWEMVLEWTDSVKGGSDA